MIGWYSLKFDVRNNVEKEFVNVLTNLSS